MCEKAIPNRVAGSVHPLEVSVAQIRHAMSFSDQEIARLSNNLVEVGTLVDRLLELMADCPGRDGSDEPGKIASRIQDVMSDSLQAFQFYDRLSQRMEHVIIVLEQLTEWTEFRASVEHEAIYAKILENFTLADERALLESMFANGKLATSQKNNNNDNAVELF